LAVSEPQANGKNRTITESEFDQALSTVLAIDHVSVISVIPYKHALRPVLRRN